MLCFRAESETDFSRVRFSPQTDRMETRNISRTRKYSPEDGEEKHLFFVLAVCTHTEYIQLPIYISIYIFKACTQGGRGRILRDEQDSEGGIQIILGDRQCPQRQQKNKPPFNAQ